MHYQFFEEYEPKTRWAREASLLAAGGLAGSALTIILVLAWLWL